MPRLARGVMAAVAYPVMPRGRGTEHPAALDAQPARPSAENAEGGNPPRAEAQNMSQNQDRRYPKIGNIAVPLFLAENRVRIAQKN